MSGRPCNRPVYLISDEPEQGNEAMWWHPDERRWAPLARARRQRNCRQARSMRRAMGIAWALVQAHGGTALISVTRQRRGVRSGRCWTVGGRHV